MNDYDSEKSGRKIQERELFVVAITLLSLLHLFEGGVSDCSVSVLADNEEDGYDEPGQTHKGERNLESVHK
ncbi:hypothetical protein [Halapricum desulfuricans]|nr:hypothetical protein [Halapricum desulfuricans]